MLHHQRSLGTQATIVWESVHTNGSEVTADESRWILNVKQVWKTLANVLRLCIPFEIHMIAIDNKGLSKSKGALSKRVK